jgi:hypothetical protein
MIRTSGSNVGVSALAVAVAVFALACSNSSSPTTPVATESEALQLSAGANVSQGDIGTMMIFRFEAVALGDPELISKGGQQYIRLEVSYRDIHGGSEETGRFRFFGNLMQEGAALSEGDEFLAKVQQDGHDGTDWSVPAFRVLEIRLSDGTS